MRRVAHQLRLGRAGPGIAWPCHVCLGRCAHHLYDRGRFADDQDSYDRFWPADVHLIGKDIVRFHAQSIGPPS